MLAGLLGAAMFVVGTAGSWQLETYLVQREDADLQAAAPTLIASTIQQESEQPYMTSAVPVNVYAARIVDTRRIHDYVPETGPRPQFPSITAQSAHASGGRPTTISSQGADDITWRMVQGIDQTTGRPYAVAVSLSNVRTVVRRMQIMTIAVSSLALLLATAAGLWAVRRALRPLRDIEDTAAAIAAGDLTRRVPEPETADEVESLAHSLNAMLSQVERSMVVKDRSEESMRRFVADASHELRTPLATVRGYAELYRVGAVTKPDDIAAGFRRIEDEATRMSGMVDDLLLLSRLETEQRAATVGANATTPTRPTSDVDLTVIAADAVADAEARATSHRFRVRGLDGPLGPVTVRGDEQRLRQVVINLVTNAERYTPDGTQVEVRVGHLPSVTGGRDAVLQVVDHGPGIPEAVREKVFDRFFRADEARNRAQGSTGLGLSIVAAIAASHHGSIDVAETPGGGATFTLRLPDGGTATSQSVQSGSAGATRHDDID